MILCGLLIFRGSSQLEEAGCSNFNCCSLNIILPKETFYPRIILISSAKMARGKKKSLLEFDVFEYKVGDLVLAVVKGYPAWPAYVKEVIVKDKDQNLYLVYFYGSYESATIHPKNMLNFEDHKEKVKNSKCSKKLLSAIEEAEKTPEIIEKILNKAPSPDYSTDSSSSSSRGSTSPKDKITKKVTKRRTSEAFLSSEVEQEEEVLAKIPRFSQPMNFSSCPQILAIQKNLEKAKNLATRCHQLGAKSLLELQKHDALVPSDLHLNAIKQEEIEYISSFEIFLSNAGESVFDQDFADTELFIENASKLRNGLRDINSKLTWKTEDVLFVVRLAHACERNKRHDFILRMFEEISKGQSIDVLQNLIKHEEMLDFSRRDPDNPEFCCSTDLLTKPLNITRMEFPWASTLEDFLTDFTFKEPTATQKVYQYWTENFTDEGSSNTKLLTAEVLEFMETAVEKCDRVPAFFSKVLQLVPEKPKYLSREEQKKCLGTEAEALALYLVLEESLSNKSDDLESIYGVLQEMKNIKTGKFTYFKYPEAAQVFVYLTTYKPNDDWHKVNKLAQEIVSNIMDLVIGDKFPHTNKHLYELLKQGNLQLVQASHASDKQYFAITQEPISVQMSRAERIKLTASVNKYKESLKRKGIEKILQKFAAANGFSLF